jgi:two-component system sensor histidine kinase TctE
MKTLLDDTLCLVRPFREPPAPLDVAAVVHAAVVGMRTDPSFRRVTMREELGEGPVTALGHEQPLRQAVTNLLVNAAQAQDGDARITVRLATEGTWAVVRVEDDGPGIPADKREKVFEAFRTTKVAGTGLGLSFVRRVAEASGGRVRVEDVAKGACVRLDLPLAP